MRYKEKIRVQKLKEDKSAMGCLILFWAPFVLVGLWAFISSTLDIYHAYKTNDWTAVIADVKSVALDSDIGRTGATSDEVKVIYEYNFDSKKHKSSNIAFGYGMNGTDGHEGLFHTLENSVKITAFVNPDKPEEAVIIRGTNDSTIGLLAFGIIWSSATAFFLLAIFTTDFMKVRLKKAILVIALIWIGCSVFILKENISLKKGIKVIEMRSDPIPWYKAYENTPPNTDSSPSF